MVKRISTSLLSVLRNLRIAASRAAMRGIDLSRQTVWISKIRLRQMRQSIYDRFRVASRGSPYYRHTLPVRIMHWINAFILVILLMSGLNILNAHPALYWGESSYRGVPPVLEFQNGFPSWITIPDHRWLALARRWHLFFAWLLTVNGVAYVIYGLASRHLSRDLAPTRRDWGSIGRSVMDHLRLRHPAGEESKRYNVLQKLTYLGVIFILLPLMILMGLGMSPALDALLPGWVDLFAGRQSIRTLHFIFAWTVVLFVVVHVFEVIVTGFWNNFRSMIMGYYRVKSEEDHGR